MAATVLDAPERLLLGPPEFRVLLIHGHQFDPLLVGTPRISAAATWFSGRLRFAGLSRLASVLENQDVEIKARRYQCPEGPYAQGASALLEETGAQAVIMGHTHVAWRLELPRGVLANCGTCSAGRLMHVSIDTAQRRVDIVQSEVPG